MIFVFDKSKVKLFSDKEYNKYRIVMLLDKCYDRTLVLDERICAFFEAYHMFRMWSKKTGKSSFKHTDESLVFFDRSDLNVSGFHALCHIERDRLMVDYVLGASEVGIDWRYWQPYF